LSIQVRQTRQFRACPEVWLSDRWTNCQQEGWDAPLYRRRQNDQWWRYSLQGPQAVELDAPVVHVSYYETGAFAVGRVSVGSCSGFGLQMISGS